MSNIMQTITQEYVRTVLNYDQDTGVFTWLTTLSNRACAGREAGSIKSNGYLSICINKRLFHAHRLAFLYMEGSMPIADTDHINGIRNDNRWCNLRRVSHAENCRNMGRKRINSSGVTGVHWHRGASKWAAEIKISGRSQYLGLFKEISQAIDARKSAEERLGFHINHGRDSHV